MMDMMTMLMAGEDLDNDRVLAELKRLDAKISCIIHEISEKDEHLGDEIKSSINRALEALDRE